MLLWFELRRQTSINFFYDKNLARIFRFTGYLIYLDLWPWRCSHTHKPLVYGRPPSLSVVCPVHSFLNQPAHYSTILLYHIHPSLLLPSSFPFPVHISVESYLRIPDIPHSGYAVPKYRSRLFFFLLTMSYWIFSRLCISLFLILSLLVTPSILRKHAILKTLSRCSGYLVGAKHSDKMKTFRFVRQIICPTNSSFHPQPVSGWYGYTNVPSPVSMPWCSQGLVHFSSDFKMAGEGFSLDYYLSNGGRGPHSASNNYNRWISCFLLYGNR